jgi:hypothetical protein
MQRPLVGLRVGGLARGLTPGVTIIGKGIGNF